MARRMGTMPATVRERSFQAALIISTLALAWLGMMADHEFGHVLCVSLVTATR